MNFLGFVVCAADHHEHERSEDPFHSSPWKTLTSEHTSPWIDSVFDPQLASQNRTYSALD